MSDPNEFTEEQRLEILRKHGIDPQKLKNYNPMFFHNIMLRIKGECVSKDPLNPDTLWFALGNPELAKKFEKDEPQKIVEGTDKAMERLAKLQKPSGKKNVVHGKRKK